MTKRKELLQLFEQVTHKALETMKGKNNDYASEEDSLANFRSSEVLNVDPRKGLLLRMLDKIKRQVNFIERGELSVDSAEDDIIDLINYSVLLHALNNENRPEQRITTESIEAKDLYPLTPDDTLESVSFEEGDIVEVIRNKGHNFDIGEKLTLQYYEKEYDSWSAVNDGGAEQWVLEEEIKPVKSTERSAGI